jgi:hypothetical protein
VTTLCSQNIAQQKRHARNQAQLKKERADNDDLLRMLDEEFRAPPTTRPDKTTALLASKRKQLSRGREENAGLRRQLEALQVHAAEQLESCDANLAAANAVAAAWEEQFARLEEVVAMLPAAKAANDDADIAEVDNFLLPATKGKRGAYVPRVRAMYMKMLISGVGTERCQGLLRSLLRLAGVPGYEGTGPLPAQMQLPSQKFARSVTHEMAALKANQEAKKWEQAEDGTVVLGSDGAAKSFAGTYVDNQAFTAFTTVAGPGTDIDSSALAVMTLTSKDTAGHVEVFDAAMDSMADQRNLNLKAHGRLATATAAGLKAKIGGTVSDAAAVQKCMNRNVQGQGRLVREFPHVLAAAPQVLSLVEAALHLPRSLQLLAHARLHEAWDSARSGCVYRAGEAGLGYYPDIAPTASKKRKRCAAAPANDGPPPDVVGESLCWLHKVPPCVMLPLSISIGLILVLIY